MPPTRTSRVEKHGKLNIINGFVKTVWSTIIEKASEQTRRTNGKKKYCEKNICRSTSLIILQYYCELYSLYFYLRVL